MAKINLTKRNKRLNYISVCNTNLSRGLSEKISDKKTVTFPSFLYNGFFFSLKFSGPEEGLMIANRNIVRRNTPILHPKRDDEHMSIWESPLLEISVLTENLTQALRDGSLKAL